MVYIFYRDNNKKIYLNVNNTFKKCINVEKTRV